MQNTLIPQYADLSFASQADFEAWLLKTTKYEIDLEDLGQDLVKFWVAENMEILHATTGMSAHLYNGCFITNGEPQELGGLKIFNPKANDESFLRFQIEKVITK